MIQISNNQPTMKGKLHKTKEGWTVTYITSDPLPDGGRWVRIAELPVLVEDVSRISQTYINDEYETVYICDGKNVDFEIVEGFAILL